MALMMAGAPWTLFEKAMYIHPTMTEGFFTLIDNVQEVEQEPDPEPANDLVDDFFKLQEATERV